MITYCMFVLLALAMWHFIWDGIIAPSRRVELRFQLFRIRDELREMKFNKQVDGKRFHLLEDSINTAIQLLPSLTVISFLESSRILRDDSELRNRIEKRIGFLRDSPNSDVPNLLERIASVAYDALLVNNGGWMIYIIPLMVVWRPVSRVQNWVSQLVALAEHEIKESRLIKYPPSTHEAAF